MLDPARYFVPKETVFRWIDLIAFHKFNTLHWHLTDTTGWRVQIDKHPKLTANTKSYYSKDDIREIVAYADKRYITIVPEIEMPGHSVFATRRMPKLTHDGARRGSYCAGKDSTFQFLEDVLSEVMELFPSKYVHIGCDEVGSHYGQDCPACQKRMTEENLHDVHGLKNYFTKRIEAFLIKKNKKVIGWEEMADADLDKSTTVMGWLGIARGVEAANQGYDVVMAPLTYVYLDYYQSRHEMEPYAWDMYLNSLKRVYQFEPIPVEIAKENRKHIIGVNAPLWQYLFHSTEQTEHMLLPRLSAVAEISWSEQQDKEWGEFCKRVAVQCDRYKALGYYYAESSMTPRLKIDYKPRRKQLDVKLDTELGLPVYYTLDGSEPTIHSRKYNTTISLTKTTTIKASCFRNNERVGYPLVAEKLMNKASRGKIVSLTEYMKEQPGEHPNALIDNVLATKRGNKENKDSRSWQGFVNRDLEVVIELEKEEKVSFFDIRFLRTPFFLPCALPLYVEYAVSEDGVTFEQVAKVDQKPAGGGAIIRHYKVEIEPVNAKYVRILAKNPYTNKQGGRRSWLYADEIIID